MIRYANLKAFFNFIRNTFEPNSCKNYGTLKECAFPGYNVVTLREML